MLHSERGRLCGRRRTARVRAWCTPGGTQKQGQRPAGSGRAHGGGTGHGWEDGEDSHMRRREGKRAECTVYQAVYAHSLVCKPRLDQSSVLFSDAQQQGQRGCWEPAGRAPGAPGCSPPACCCSLWHRAFRRSRSSWCLTVSPCRLAQGLGSREQGGRAWGLSTDRAPQRPGVMWPLSEKTPGPWAAPGGAPSSGPRV